MSPVAYSKKRINACLKQIRQLQASEFPYTDGETALQEIRQTLENHLSYLDLLTEEDDLDTRRAATTSALSALFKYVPLLGFILRSTNVRNAFEIRGPLLRLSCQILGKSTKLILSSEWDYSPFTYIGVPILSDYVLIGFPAPESANPLLTPLAGHEIGHSVWAREGLTALLEVPVEAKIVADISTRWEEYSDLFPGVAEETLEANLFTEPAWRPAQLWALQQLEETFCDFVGLAIFGESFLHAIAYLLSPGQAGRRLVSYPSMRTRASNLEKAAADYGVPIPSGYIDLFEDVGEPTENERWMKFFLSLADDASESIVPSLISKAREAVSSAGIQNAEEEKVAEIYDGFKRFIVPPRDPKTLMNILNAAWRAFHDQNLWQSYPVKIDDPDTILKELVLKSIEVLEFKQLVGKPS